MLTSTRSSGAADELLARCPICMDAFSSPVVLKCGHRFCDPCIRTALDYKKECPACRVKSTHRELRADTMLAKILGCAAPARAIEPTGLADEIPMGDTWTCGSCTMHNLLVASRCVVCSARRPASAVRVPPTAATSIESTPRASAAAITPVTDDDDRVRVGARVVVVGARQRASSLEAATPQKRQRPYDESAEDCKACKGKHAPHTCSAEHRAERRAELKAQRYGPYDESAEERKKRNRLDRRAQAARMSPGPDPGTGDPKLRCPHCRFQANSGSGFAGHMKFCFSIRVREAANKATQQGAAIEDVAAVTEDAAVGAAAVALREAAERALQQAKDEGLTLMRAPNASGYRGVYDAGYGWFGCHVTRNGQFLFMGKTQTAEEAALIYARTPEAKEYAALKAAEEAEDRSLPQTAEDCWAQADAEGVTLMPAKNAAGFHGVVIAASCRGSPRANVTPYYSTGVPGKEAGKRNQDKGILIYVGKYRLPEQAALVYARTPAGRAEAELRMTAAKAIATAKQEGLELIPSSKNSTGYLYVTAHPGSGRYQVCSPPAGPPVLAMHPSKPCSPPSPRRVRLVSR